MTELQLIPEKPLESFDDDYINMKPQVEILKNAIKSDDINLIWLKGDFATGKSSITHLLESNWDDQDGQSASQERNETEKKGKQVFHKIKEWLERRKTHDGEQ